MEHNEPTPAGAVLAYALSAATTLLWVGAVLPAGAFAEGPGGDLASPMQREAWLLVGALLLLVIGPVGVTLARGRTGHLGVLAATDGFIACYAALGLTLHGAYDAMTTGVLTTALYALALLSAAETLRVLLRGDASRVAPPARGIRLAVCLLVLLMPSSFLMRDGQEYGSLLLPFAFVAVGAAGASIARTAVGVRLVSSTIHLALAAHVFITIRYAIFDAEPGIVRVNPIGWSTLGLAGLCLLLALLQVVRRAHHLTRMRPPSPAHGAQSVVSG